MTRAVKTQAKRGKKTGGQKPPPRAPGRPAKFRDEYVVIARTMADLGATLAEFADAFSVDIRTITRWRYEHPDFDAALKVGKEAADARVEQSLYRRATGYDFDSEEIKIVEGEIHRLPIRKHVPPDTTAGIFWLINRSEGRWNDVKKVKHDVDKGGALETFFEQIQGRSIRPREG